MSALDHHDELMLRRAAAAARNIRAQASALSVAWFDWVAPWLDGLADRLAEPSIPDEVDERQVP